MPARSVRASIEFYAKLGFSLAEVGETRRHPYAVATDGRLCLGLHGIEDLEPTMSFVRPQLLAHLDQYEALGVEFELRRLGNDVFNEIGWRDPGGNAIRLVEARTFSPSQGPAGGGVECGYFREIALPAIDVGASKAHWEDIGFVAIEEDGPFGPYASCTSDTVNVGLYDPRRISRSTLIFEAEDLERTAAALAKNDVAASADSIDGRLCGLRFTAPEGTPFLISPAV